MTMEYYTLIVDDDERNIFALTAIFKSKGLKYLTAVDGREAIRMLEENPQINLVLLDMMMPVTDGFEALRQIRMHEKLKEMPVIALTAKAMLGDREKCLEAGANGYVSKPVNVAELFNEIDKLFKK